MRITTTQLAERCAVLEARVLRLEVNAAKAAVVHVDVNALLSGLGREDKHAEWQRKAAAAREAAMRQGHGSVRVA